MRLLDALSTRSLGINNLDDYAAALSSFGYAGVGYPTTYGAPVSTDMPPGLRTTMQPEKAEPISDDFVGLCRGAYKANGVVFACMLARQLAFSAVRFSWQRLNTGKQSELFGTAELGLLEEPWPGGTTQDLLSRLIQDSDLAGNAYWTRWGDRLFRLRPDWVYILAGQRVVPGMNRDDQGRSIPATLGWERLGYAYFDGGWQSGAEPVFLEPDQVAHYAPIPDPEATFRGMSWLSPIVAQVQADKLMTKHQVKFFEHGGTPNLIITHSENASMEKVLQFAARLQEGHAGVENAYKSLNLYPGADARVVGSNLEQLDFKVTQGGGETRVAAAARVPAIIVGLSEGLQAATYSNYGQARRAYADGTMHPLWGNAAGSFTPLFRADIARLSNGGKVRLWYDPRDVPLLREDAKEAAEIGEIQARTIRTYVDGGYTPESAKRAVLSGDLQLLAHTGLFSVQLQQPGAAEAAPASTNAGAPTEPAGASAGPPQRHMMGKHDQKKHGNRYPKDGASVSPAAQGLSSYPHVDASNPFNAPDVSNANREDYAKKGATEAKIAAVVDDWTGGGATIPQIREQIANGEHAEVVQAARDGVVAPKLYRGFRSFDDDTETFLRNMSEGDEMDLGGLSSVSESEQWADGFAYGVKSGVLLEIRDARGLPIRNISNSPHEDEWLLTGKLTISKITEANSGLGGVRQMKAVATWSAK